MRAGIGTAAWRFGRAVANIGCASLTSQDREVPLGHQQLHVRVEAFNVLNTVNLDTPNRFVNTPQFGTITQAATAARQIQFSLRATF